MPNDVYSLLLEINCPCNFWTIIRAQLSFFFFFLDFFFLGSWNHDKSERNMYLCIYKYTYIPRESTKSYRWTTPTYKVTIFCFELFKELQRGSYKGSLSYTKLCFLGCLLLPSVYMTFIHVCGREKPYLCVLTYCGMLGKSKQQLANLLYVVFVRNIEGLQFP